MENKTTTAVSIRIYGTQQRQGGFSALVTAGAGMPLSDAEATQLMDRPLVVPEKQSVAFRHREDYILYQLVDTQVMPYDAATNGRLSIVVTIPKALQLAGGKSAYDLLREVHDVFRSRYMTPQQDGSYTFRNVEIDSAPFRELLINEYPTEPRRTSYVPMTPQGPAGVALVSPDNYAALFRDTQYAEFRPYSEIVVTSSRSANITPGFDQLQIPRPSIYTVWVNGQSTGVTLSQPDDGYTTVVPSNVDVLSHNVSFSLQELMDAPGMQMAFSGGSTVILNLANNRIDCRVRQEERFCDVIIRLIAPSEDDEQWLRKLIGTGKVSINYGGHNLSRSINENPPARVRPSQSGGKASISPSRIDDDYRLSVDTMVDDSNPGDVKVIITVTMERKAQVPPAISRNRMGGVNRSGGYSQGGYRQSGVSTQGSQTALQGGNHANRDRHGDATSRVQNGGNVNALPSRFNSSLIIGLIAGIVIGALGMLIYQHFRDKKEPELVVAKPLVPQVPDPDSIAVETPSVSENVNEEDPYGQSSQEVGAESRSKEQQREQLVADEKAKAEENAKKEEERKKKAKNAIEKLLSEGKLQEILNKYNKDLTKTQRDEIKTVIWAKQQAKKDVMYGTFLKESYNWKTLKDSSDKIKDFKASKR